MSNKQENKPVEKPKEKKEVLIGDKRLKPGQQVLND